MNALEAALYAALTGDASLMALVSAVYHRRAPEATSGVWLVYAQEGATDSYTKGGRRIVSATYMVKALAEGEDNTGAVAALDRVDAILTDGAWYAGLMVCRRSSRFEYDEIDNGTPYQHVGGRWRVQVEA